MIHYYKHINALLNITYFLIKSILSFIIKFKQSKKEKRNYIPILSKNFTRSLEVFLFNSLLNFGKHLCMNSLNDCIRVKKSLLKIWLMNYLLLSLMRNQLNISQLSGKIFVNVQNKANSSKRPLISKLKSQLLKKRKEKINKKAIDGFLNNKSLDKSTLSKLHNNNWF